MKKKSIPKTAKKMSYFWFSELIYEPIFVKTEGIT